MSSSQLFMDLVNNNAGEGFNLTNLQRNFISQQVNNAVNSGNLSPMYHAISSIEQSSLQEEMEGLPNGSIIEVNGSLGVAYSGVRLFWYKMDDREIYQIETNTNVNQCILVAFLDF